MDEFLETGPAKTKPSKCSNSDRRTALSEVKRKQSSNKEPRTRFDHCQILKYTDTYDCSTNEKGRAIYHTHSTE